MKPMNMRMRRQELTLVFQPTETPVHANAFKCTNPTLEVDADELTVVWVGDGARGWTLSHVLVVGRRWNHPGELGEKAVLHYVGDAIDHLPAEVRALINAQAPREIDVASVPESGR
ncbi:hypothetical protein [Nocardia sp. NPDC050435]|uniref:hypothetical protein n=1 Tax=Nocardia sp. NPDC050435 TaxID=3155040 RepID=UPI0033F1A8D0